MYKIRNLIAIKSVKGVGRTIMRKLSLDKIESIKTAPELSDYITYMHDNLSKRITTVDIDTANILLNKADDIIYKSEKEEIHIFTIYDNNYPKNFINASDPPIIFYAKGNYEVLNHNCISMVGTREASNTGCLYGKTLSMRLAERGYVIVSGLALGCDTVAHLGCVEIKKPTVAILAHGLDIVYPKQNYDLSNKIIATGGCLISEYPIGTPLSKYSLVERDRLQSYLSNGLIVIETGVKGGTLHAFNTAIKENKVVACIGYKENHYEQYIHSMGNKKFIEDGIAMKIDSPEAIDRFLEKSFNTDLLNNDSDTIMNSNYVEQTLF